MVHNTFWVSIFCCLSVSACQYFYLCVGLFCNFVLGIIHTDYCKDYFERYFGISLKYYYVASIDT